METQKSYYITTEKMSVGYDGKPLIEEVEIMLRKGEILTLLHIRFSSLHYNIFLNLPVHFGCLQLMDSEHCTFF